MHAPQRCTLPTADCCPSCPPADCGCKQVKERKSELARLETSDMGKPIAEAEWDMDDVAGCFEYYAGVGRGGGGRIGLGASRRESVVQC